MPLKIIRGEDVQVENLLLTIYARPSAGKTSLAFTANNPLVLDFDRGAHRSSSRTGQAVVQVFRWDDITGMTRADVQDFNTIVVDTAGAACDMIGQHLIMTNARRYANGTSLSLQGWGMLKTTFQTWLSGLRSYGKDVVLICHAEEAQRKQDDDEHEAVERIAVPGASKAEIYSKSDLVGRIILDGSDRILSFEQSKYSWAKNVGLPPRPIPDASTGEMLLAQVIDEAKDAINIQTDGQRLERERLSALRESLLALPAESLAFNAKAVEIKESSPSPQTDGKMLMEIALQRGLGFDKVKRAFYGDEPSVSESGEEPFTDAQNVEDAKASYGSEVDHPDSPALKMPLGA